MCTQAILDAPVAAADAPVLYLPGPSLRRISTLNVIHTDALIKEAYSAELAWLGFQPLEAVFAVVGVIVVLLAWSTPRPQP